MATTKKSKNAIAEKWAAGVEHFAEAQRPVNEEISQEAARMRQAGAAPEEIVAMAARKQQEFSREYHTHDD